MRIYRKPSAALLMALLESPAEPFARREALERLGDPASARKLRSDALHDGLGTIGSVAPFIGLFGPSWHYPAFGRSRKFRRRTRRRRQRHRRSADTTALGLFVAIPLSWPTTSLRGKSNASGDDMQLCVDEVIDLTGSADDPFDFAQS